VTTVLVVDDEPKMRELRLRSRAPAGHLVQEAGDAQAAIVLTTGVGGHLLKPFSAEAAVKRAAEWRVAAAERAARPDDLSEWLRQ